MSELNNHQMKVGVGFTVDSTQITKLQEAANAANTVIQDLATSIAPVSKAINQMKKSNDDYTQSVAKTNQEVKQFSSNTVNLMNGLKSGTVSAKNTIKALHEEYAKLNELLRENKNDKQAQNRIRALMAQTVSAINQTENQITQMRKLGLDTRVQMHDTSIKKELNAQRDKVQKLKSIWQEEANNYKSTQAQMNATSSLTNFNSVDRGEMLRHNLVGASLQLAGIRTLTAEFQNMGREIIEINYNLTNTQRIMEDFSSETADFLFSNAAEVAKSTNSQISDVQEIQSAWVRINDQYAKNKELLADITELTAKFKNVGEIEDAEEAVKLLNAALLQFNVTASQTAEKSEEFLNKWAYMADITAMGTADEYGEAISRFGANVNALNGDMDEAIALSSVLADRLAKTGEEAGTSLKTFTAYMNRSKTLDLFNTIAEDLGDTNFQLSDANGRLKDFDENLRTIAKAYQVYKNAGNDVMAQKVLEAVGATRQRDAALAILSSINDGSYDEYLGKVSDSSEGYLDKQNLALMETFKAQWNELKVSIQEFGMAIAENGALQAVTALMNGLSGLASIVSKLPDPLIQIGVALGGLKLAKAAGTYIGELTGITQKYQTLVKHGTTAEIENANAISKNANAYMARMEYMGKNNLLSEQAVHTLWQQKQTLSELNAAYNNGEITATEYANAVTNLIGKKQLESNATSTATQAVEKANSADNKHLVTYGNKIRASEKAAQKAREEAAAENANTNATNKDSAATLYNSFVKGKNAWASVTSAAKEKLLTASVSQNTAATNLSTIATNMLSGAMNGLATAAGFLTGAMGALMSVLSPIMMIYSLGSMLWSVVSPLFDNMTTSVEELEEELQGLQQELDETQSRIEELQQLNKSNGLSSAEAEELEYLEQKNKLLKESIQLQQQEINNAKWNDKGGFLGFGTDENSKKSLQDMINSYNDAKLSVEYYADTLKELDPKLSASAPMYAEQLTESNKELRESALDLYKEYTKLKENFENGFYSGEAETEVSEYLQQLETMLPTITAIAEGHQNLSDTIHTLADETEMYAEDINSLNDKVSDLNDLFKEYNKEGYLSYETVSKLVAEHPDYVKYLVKVGDQYKLNKVAEEELNRINQDIIKSTDEMIAKLDEQSEIGQQVSQDMIDAIDAVDYFTTGLKDTFGEVEGVDEFIDGLREINVSLLKGESTIDEYNASMNELINNTDFSKVNDDITQMDENTRNLAMSQQAMLTTLAQETSNYMMEITNALFTGEMAATDYINALQGSNENLLDMYTVSNDLVQNQEGQWVDAAGAVDTYANSLQNAINGLNGMTEASQLLGEHQTILAELQANTANGMVDATWWAANQQSTAYQSMATDFSSLMGNLYTNNRSAWEGIVRDVLESTNYQTTNIVNSNGTITEAAQNNAAIMGAFTTATMNTVGSSVQTAASAAGNVITSLGEMIDSFEYTLNFVPEANLKFDASRILKGESPFVGSGLKLKITGEGGTSVKNFANSLSAFGSSLKSVDFGSFFNNISSYKPSGYTPVGAAGLTGSGYSPSDYKTPATRTPTDSKSGSSKNSAADELEKAAKAIEKLTNEYVKNVESLQKRIADALKKQYQEQYDERKKLLEKEHNDRVAQIQAEIDKINGVTPEDKQSQLAGLKAQYKKWLADDSTLGKAKQKEYLDQIEELEKEIKIDELEKQLDEENENYQNSIDSDSEFYDAILKKLDQQMTDEALYREANDLIRNNKIQDITDLLTKYDSQWDGWATLMGKTAGEVIAEEVALALANYKDVKDGTITENGGVNTNAITGGPTTSTSTSSSTSSTSTSSGGAVTKGSKVRINDTSAGMYYTSTSSGAVGNWKGYNGTYYVVNTNAGRVALARTNNINGAIGWIPKGKVTKLATGGYTGEHEGLAYLHQKERVLSAQQTSAFEHLVYDFLPKISSSLLNPVGDTFNNGGNVTFNKELVKVEIDKVVNNTPSDLRNSEDNLDRLVRQSLKKSGINLKK